MSIWLGNKKLAGDIVKYSHNIGDIFYTSRTDTTLAGAVECNGATYQTTDYTGTGSIGELLNAGKLPYISLSQYASDLAAHGSVRAFGWDGGSSTAFRVPTLSNVFLEAGQAVSAGEYISAGLPNITGDFEADYQTYASALSGAFNRTVVDTTAMGGGGLGTNHCSYSFDASRSSSVYGNSTTVQPNAVKYRAMVQLFNGVTDEAVATVGTVVAQVGELNTRTDGMIDYVVEKQEPTAGNGYTWYRKYKSGWVEQGGTGTLSSSAYTATFPIEMADIKYHVSLMSGTVPVNDATTCRKTTAKTTTSMTIYGTYAFGGGTGYDGGDVIWKISGMAAE